MDDHHEEFVDSVLNVLGDKVADHDDVNQKSTVGEYWEKGYQAVLLYQNSDTIPQYEGKIWPRRFIWSKWPNTGDPDELHDKLKDYVGRRNGNKFFVLQGILTPDVHLIKNELLESGGLSIKKFADRCSCKVVDWCEDEFSGSVEQRQQQQQQQSLNVVIVDFFENCSMIPSIISYNRK
jgi:hypothetical protein